MGLFDRRAGKGAPFDWLVVGLGNPGKEYAAAVTTSARNACGCWPSAIMRRSSRGATTPSSGRARYRRRLARVVLAFPITYVNESGQAVAALVRRYKIEEPGKIIVVHDELDLEPGTMRLKVNGGLAGHNGLRSISQHLKTQDFLRVRIGVGKPPHKDRGPPRPESDPEQ